MSGTRNILKAFLGGLIMAVGLLIAGLAGICTVTFAVMAAKTSSLTSLPMVIGIGGTPIVIGVVIFLAGLHLWRSSKKSA